MTSAPVIPFPPDVRTLLVFGGAFDPPHKAHVTLAPAARDALALDFLLYIPAASSPLKAGAPRASGEDRVEMLRLALNEAGVDRAAVSDLEIHRGGTSYTIDTLRILRTALPHVQSMRLLIGADQTARFHEWRAPEEVLRLAEPVVMLRPPEETPESLIESLAEHWPSRELRRWRSRVVSLPAIDISSTEVRAILWRDGPDAPALKGRVPDSVLEYIRRRGLYRAAP